MKNLKEEEGKRELKKKITVASFKPRSVIVALIGEAVKKGGVLALALPLPCGRCFLV